LIHIELRVRRHGFCATAECSQPAPTLCRREADVPSTKRSPMIAAGYSRVACLLTTPRQLIWARILKDLVACRPRIRESEPVNGGPCREAFYVPEFETLGRLLRDMQQHKYHMAIAVDEYGLSLRARDPRRPAQEIGSARSPRFTVEILASRSGSPHGNAARPWLTPHRRSVNEELKVNLGPIDTRGHRGGGAVVLLTLRARPEEGECRSGSTGIEVLRGGGCMVRRLVSVLITTPCSPPASDDVHESISPS